VAVRQACFGFVIFMNAFYSVAFISIRPEIRSYILRFTNLNLDLHSLYQIAFEMCMFFCFTTAIFSSFRNMYYHRRVSIEQEQESTFE